ncbi:MAG: ArnT family glycosyltransferase, partial [Candidatus Omnitrophota bacterium]
FYYPTFFMYLAFFMYGALYVAGFLVRHFQSPNDLLNLFLTSPEIFYVLPRLLSAVFGTLTVWLAYLTGREYEGRRTGLLAAFFLAINFLHCRDSHFATTDIAMTFFIVLSMLTLLKSIRQRRKALYFLSVFFAGVATSVKYNSFVLLISLFLSYGIFFLADRWKMDRKKAVLQCLADGVLAGGLCFAGFFIFSPYVVLDWGSARQFLLHLQKINAELNVPFFYHFKMLYHAMGMPLLAAAVAGGVFSPPAFRGKVLVLASLILPYYILVARAGQPHERYILPLIPFLAIWAAHFFAGLFERASKDRRLAGLPAIVLLLMTLLTLPKTLFSDMLFMKRDTRDLAKEWLEKNAPSGSVLALDDPMHGPRLVRSKDQVKEALARLGPEGPLRETKSRRLAALLSLEPYPSPHYNLFYLSRSDEAGLFSLQGPFVAYDFNELGKISADYLVTSGTERGNNPEFYVFAEKHFEVAAEFDPLKNRSGETTKGWTTMPIDKTLWAFKRPGPLIRIFRLKSGRA